MLRCFNCYDMHPYNGEMCKIRKIFKSEDFVKITEICFFEFDYFPEYRGKLIIKGFTNNRDGTISVHVLCEDGKYRTVDSILHISKGE